MIPEAEIRRVAARLGVDVMLADLDYVQGCFLDTLYRQAEAQALCFKGGTCLKKCYYSDYRFSEDLDFTLAGRFSKTALEKLLNLVVAEARDRWEIDFGVRPLRVEVVDDDYGKESYQVRLYYRGPLRRTGDPRAIRLDVTRDEVLVFPVNRRGVLHGYTDADLLSNVQVPCYDLLEMLAEKVRAVAGQRTHAISRDIYDVYQLTSRVTVDANRLVEAMPPKWKVKGLKMSEFRTEQIEDRRAEFKRDWEVNLLHLMPSEGMLDFETAWNGTKPFLDKVIRKWRHSEGGTRG